MHGVSFRFATLGSKYSKRRAERWQENAASAQGFDGLPTSNSPPCKTRLWWIYRLPEMLSCNHGSCFVQCNVGDFPIYLCVQIGLLVLGPINVHISLKGS